MNFDLVINIETCYQYLKEEVPLGLVYYSHIPTTIVATLIGIFVLFKNKSLASKLLFSLAIVFSLWSFIDLLLWISLDSRIYMFFWAIEFILEILLFVISLYFVYAFIDKKDVSFKLKLIWSLIVAPIIILASTGYALTNFDATQCNPTEGPLWENYVFPLELIFALWIIIFSVLRFRKSQREEKAKIILLMLGICLFLGTFSLAGYIVNLTGFNYKYELFGLIGLPIFLGFLAYLIVRYKAFNIKLLGTQALVILLISLIGALFFYVQESGGRILILINLALAVGFGYILVKSVKAEVKRKEELQYMSDQLAKANDQLKKLDNAKSDFISIASHQLRTPLTSIKGFISLLSEGSYGKVTPVQQETLNKVYQSNERLIHLVEDLLDISRIESGRMEFDFAPCQLADLCQEVVDGFAIRAKNSKLYLDYKNPAVLLPEIMIDAGKVREVISNMVDNALKYTPKGGVTLRVERGEFPISKYQFPNNDQNSNPEYSGQNSKDKKDVIRITVTDTGIGIPVTELPYLFSKFSRGKDIGRLNVAGTGLGLYVGRSMIEANGGHIWAESEGEGKGSRFIIELPVKQSPEILAQWGK